jgi:hypothetical protein
VIECPYCLDEIEEPDEATACRSCGALYHPECWAEGEGCCVRDCASAKHRIELEVPATDTAEVVVSREAAEKAIPHTTRKPWNPCLRCGRHLPAGELYCRECKPEKEDSQDARNVGPMLLMLALLVIVLGWILVTANTSNDKQEKPDSTRIENRLKR